MEKLDLTAEQHATLVAALKIYLELLRTLQREGTYSAITKERIGMLLFLLALFGVQEPA